MSRQTDKEEREAQEREAEAKAKAKAKAKEEAEREEAAAKAKTKSAKEAKPDLGRDDDVESAQKPYPQGNPPDPEDEFEKIHGFRREVPK
jgi:hypothetical protein